MPKTVEDVLAHYGIKGMKWGVRRSRKELERLRNEPVSVKVKPGERVKTKGGRKSDPSDDAIRAATLRQKARASTVDSLTNAQLRELTQRMNLEAQYADLVKRTAPPKSRSRKLIDQFIDTELKNIATGKPTTSAKLAKVLADQAKKKKKKG